MQINRHNYEEYFILYVDNELGNEDRRMVEEFVQVHPDLQEELDILLQSKFTPDKQIVFHGKEELLFGRQPDITLDNYEEWLVLYMDDELNTDQRIAVEQFTALHPPVKDEMNLLLRTRLEPETIIFPDKQSLYRKEVDTRKRPVIGWRMAAAAILILFAGTTAIMLLNKQAANIVGPEMVNTNPPAKQPGNDEPVNSDKNNIVATQPNSVQNDQPVTIQAAQNNSPVKNANNPGNKQPVPNKIVPAKTDQLAIIDKKPTNDLPQPDENPYVNPDLANKTTAIATNTNSPKPVLTNPNETTNTTPVTKDAITASLPTVDDEPDGKKNKLRGFFRKVTRNFEKRTNIEATDGDDRLLVGGLAIRLK